MYTVSKICPMCNEMYDLTLMGEEENNYWSYWNGKGYIQDMLPSLNPVEREFIKTGYCPHCQEMLFGNGETDRVVKA